MKLAVLFFAVVAFFQAKSSYADEIAITEASLIERYKAAFSPHANFDEQLLVQLEKETRKYFYAQGASIAENENSAIQRLHSKLLIYLNFYQINIKARGKDLTEWNYYRLLLDAIRDVDHHHISVINDKSGQHYDLLRESARAYLLRAIKTYSEHFLFLDWDFCSRFTSSCAVEEREDSWQTSEELAKTLNEAVDLLNKKVDALNEVIMSKKMLFFVGATAKYRGVLQDYLRTYKDLADKPYGGLLLLAFTKQQNRLVTSPHIFSSYRFTEFSYVDTEMVEKLFAQIEEMFNTRIQKLAALSDKDDKKLFVSFLIKYHSQALAEFLINHPRFFYITNYYLDLANADYVTAEKREERTKHSGKLASASVLGLSYAVVHRLLQFKASPLFHLALLGGAGAAAYNAIKQKSLSEVFILQKQIKEMRSSLVMGQSRGLSYFLHKLGQFFSTKDAAIFQSGILSLYSLFFLRHIRKIENLRNLDALKVGETFRLTAFDSNVIYKNFRLGEIENVVESYPHPHKLPIPERMELISRLFGNYQPFITWQRKAGQIGEFTDLNDEQAASLREIGKKLARKFEPTDENIQEVASKLDETREETVIAGKMEHMKRFICKLFDIDTHQDNVAQTF